MSFYKDERVLVGFLLIIIGSLTAIDVFEDLQVGTELRHLGLDLTIAISSFIAVGYLFGRVILKQKKLKLLNKEKTILLEIAKTHQTNSRLLVEGLSGQIDREFSEWGLTPSEREVCLFLLKGVSVQDISSYRKSTEKTIRHQSGAIYKKAGLKGRGELQAYFLEDLL